MERFLRYLMIWSAVCIGCAASSFALALYEYSRAEHLLAMLAGIGCYVVAYAAFSCSDFAARLRRQPFVLTTLGVGYGTRIGISMLGTMLVVTPAALILPDIWIGAFVIEEVTERLFRDSSFLMVFTTTLLVGAVWNVILLIYMLIVYGLQRAYRPLPGSAGMCVECGYDLRASIGVCPECGTPIPQRAITT